MVAILLRTKRAGLRLAEGHRTKLAPNTDSSLFDCSFLLPKEAPDRLDCLHRLLCASKCGNAEASGG